MGVYGQLREGRKRSRGASIRPKRPAKRCNCRPNKEKYDPKEHAFARRKKNGRWRKEEKDLTMWARPRRREVVTKNPKRKYLLKGRERRDRDERRV